MECYYFVIKEEQYERDIGEHLGHMTLEETGISRQPEMCSCDAEERIKGKIEIWEPST